MNSIITSIILMLDRQLLISNMMTRARIYLQQYVFFRLLIIDFVSNVHKSHDDVNDGIFVLHVFAYLK